MGSSLLLASTFLPSSRIRVYLKLYECRAVHKQFFVVVSCYLQGLFLGKHGFGAAVLDSSELASSDLASSDLAALTTASSTRAARAFNKRPRRLPGTP
jgi:hypothetical protein